MERWRDGEMERWGDGETERLRDWETERRRDGERGDKEKVNSLDLNYHKRLNRDKVLLGLIFFMIIKKMNINP